MTELIYKELQLTKNQLSEYESMVFLDTLLFLMEEDVEYGN